MEKKVRKIDHGNGFYNKRNWEDFKKNCLDLKMHNVCRYARNHGNYCGNYYEGCCPKLTPLRVPKERCPNHECDGKLEIMDEETETAMCKKCTTMWHPKKWKHNE